MTKWPITRNSGLANAILVAFAVLLQVSAGLIDLAVVALAKALRIANILENADINAGVVRLPPLRR